MSCQEWEIAGNENAHINTDTLRPYVWGGCFDGLITRFCGNITLTRARHRSSCHFNDGLIQHTNEECDLLQSGHRGLTARVQ